MFRKGTIYVLVALAVAIFGMTTTQAESDNAATVVGEFGCSLIAADSGLGIGLFTSEKTHSVTTSSGNTVLICHFDIPEGFEPNKALVTSGFLCSTNFGLTNNSRSRATPGGNALLVCQINGSN